MSYSCPAAAGRRQQSAAPWAGRQLLQSLAGPVFKEAGGAHREAAWPARRGRARAHSTWSERVRKVPPTLSGPLPTLKTARRQSVDSFYKRLIISCLFLRFRTTPVSTIPPVAAAPSGTGAAGGAGKAAPTAYSTVNLMALLPARPTYTPAGRASAAVPAASTVAEVTGRPSAFVTVNTVPGSAPARVATPP